MILWYGNNSSDFKLLFSEVLYEIRVIGNYFLFRSNIAFLKNLIDNNLKK